MEVGPNANQGTSATVDILEEVLNWPTHIYNQLKEQLATRAETSIQYIFINFLYIYYKIKIFRIL